jgi:hypothetical protein
VTGPRRWPLVLIAAPAAVSIWSGWVGLGEKSGFGIVHPLPGIVSALQINTAITLPVGVEAYGAYALGAWLSLARDHPARTFARRSAIGSLVLGMLGQVAYHLLAAAHATRAPWPVVVAVSCMPVVTLGFGAALTHLLRAAPAEDVTDVTARATALASDLADGLGALAAELRVALAVPVAAVSAARPAAADMPAAPGGDTSLTRLAEWLTGGTCPMRATIAAPASADLGSLNGTAAAPPAGVPGTVPEPVPARVPEPVPEAVLAPVSPARAQARPAARAPQRARSRAQARRDPVTAESAEAQFAAVLAQGRVPSLRQVKDELKVGTDKARELRQHLETLTGART